MEKDSFILYNDQFECFSLLSMEQRGLLITAIFEFSQTGTTTQDLTGATHMAYHLITRQLNRDSQKYKRICEKRKAAIESRYVQMNTNEYKCIQKNSTVTDTDTDTDNDNDTDNDIEKEIYKEKEEPKEPEEPEEKKLSAIEKRFNAFWDAYPKKVSKLYAFKCFEKLKVSDELLAQMLKAIEAQKKSIEWTKDGGEFIPHPSTWLNQGRWEDELTPIDNAPKTAENRPQQPKTTTEANIPRFSNYDADDAFKAALKRTYGG